MLIVTASRISYPEPKQCTSPSTDHFRAKTKHPAPPQIPIRARYPQNVLESHGTPHLRITPPLLNVHFTTHASSSANPFHLAFRNAMTTRTFLDAALQGNSLLSLLHVNSLLHTPTPDHHTARAPSLKPHSFWFALHDSILLSTSQPPFIAQSA